MSGNVKPSDRSDGSIVCMLSVILIIHCISGSLYLYLYLYHVCSYRDDSKYTFYQSGQFIIVDTHTGEVLILPWIFCSSCSSSELLLAVASESKASCRPLSTAWLDRLNSLSSIKEDEAVDKSSWGKWGLQPTCGGSISGCMGSGLSRERNSCWQCLFSPSSCCWQCSKACSPSRACSLLCSLWARLCSPVCLESCSFTASSKTTLETGWSVFTLLLQGCTEDRGGQPILATFSCVNTEE